ncbi:MAG: ABC1 kinase family protein [Clostridia bacterium]
MDKRTRFKEIISILKKNNITSGLTPEKLCSIITELGPTFIKIGQIMSSRYDIFPKEYCDALSQLRANVIPMEYSEVIEILKEQYIDLDEIFLSIEKTSIGSASIAQVHKAKLKNGENVAIKVQRKNVYETMTVDVQIIKKIIKLLHINSIVKLIDLNSIIDEMYNVAKEEMNFEIEAKHLEEFKENNKDINYVYVPKIYTNLVTKKVLVMEYIDGFNLTNKKILEENGYDLEEIGLKLSNNYIKQALEDGFFHADPHPDNICIRDGRIVFLDLGMMGRISNKNKSLLKKAAKAIVENNVSELEHILLCISTTTESVNHTKLREEIQSALDKYVNEDITNINIIEFTSYISKILRENKISLDKNIALLMRGICVMEGTLERISPNLNLLLVLSNNIKEESLRELFSKDTLVTRGKSLMATANSINELPNELLNFIRDINRGETKFDIEMANSDKQVNKLEKMLHQLIIGLLDAAVLLGASIVNNQALRWIYIALAVIFTIWLLINMLKDHFHNGY